MPVDGSVIIDTKLDPSGLQKGLENLGKVATGATSLAAKGIAAVSGGLTAAAKFAADAGMSFDSAMAQVAATMGQTVDDIQILSDVAQEMGSKTKFSATEAAEALNYLALAGYDAQTAADTLPAVLDLAAAGGMSLAYASDLATDAMSALGISASQENLAHFGDEMAMTASKANTSVAQLGEAILTVGGTAKSLAGGTVELNAALGVLANRGIKGAEGGTHLRNIILSLTAPTDKAAEAMEALGIKITDAQGNMRPLNDILADFNTAMDGMSDPQKTEILNEIFNKTDLAAIQGLLAGVGDEWNNLTTNIQSADGAMSRMAETQIDNLEGDITIFKSAMEGLGIAAYDGFRDSARDIVQLGSGLVTELTNAMKQGGYEQLSSSIGDVLVTALAKVSGFIPNVVALSVKVIRGLCDGLRKNLRTLSKGIADTLVTAIQGITEIIPDILDAGLQIAISLVEGISESLPALIPKLIEGIANAIVGIVKNAGAILKAGLAIAEALVTGIISALPSLVQGVLDVFGNLWNSITGIFGRDLPEPKVTVNTNDARNDVAGLRLDLDNLPETVTVKTIVTEDGVTQKAALLQSIKNKDGTTVNVYAICDEAGNVTAFQREVNDIEGNTISLEVAVPEEGEGSITWAEEEIAGITVPETKINLGFAENGDPEYIQSQIGEIHGSQVTVTAIYDGSAVPEFKDIPVSVIISDSRETLQSVRNEIDGFKRDYAAQAIDINVNFNKAQSLIDQLEQVQSSSTTAQMNVEGLSGYQGILNTMASSLIGVSGGVLSMINSGSTMFREDTKKNWEDCSGYLSSIAASATTLGSDLGGICSAEFPSQDSLKSAASDAIGFADGLREGAEQLRQLASSTKDLNPAKAAQLNTWADELEAMATNAGTLAASLTEISNKEVLNPEDVEQLKGITEQLVKLYPELAKYVGDDGILSMEAAKVRELTNQYRQLALVKASQEYITEAASAVAQLELEQEKLQMVMDQLSGQNSDLEAQAKAWQEISDKAGSAAESYVRWNQARFSGDADGMEREAESLNAFLNILEQIGPEAIKGAEGFEHFIDEEGKLKSPDEILTDAEAMKALGGVFQYLQDNADLNMQSATEQIEANNAAIREAAQTQNELTPALEAANKELDNAVRIQENLKDKLGITNESTQAATQSMQESGAAAEETAKDLESAASAMETAGEEAGEAATQTKEAAEQAEEAASTIKTANDAAKESTEEIAGDVAAIKGEAAEISQVLSDIQQAQEEIEKARTAVATAKQDMSAAAKAAYDDLVACSASIITLAQAMIQSCKDAFDDDALNAFLEIGIRIVEKINEGISNKAVKESFISSASKVVSAVKDALTDKIGKNGSQFNSFGKDIVQGIADGVKNNTGILTAAMTKLINEALAAAKRAAETGSPSKLFRDDLGQWLSKGVAAGVDDYSYTVQDSMKNLIKDADEIAESFDFTRAYEDMQASIMDRHQIFGDGFSGSDSWAIDYEALGRAVWENAPENLAINQTINFNRPIQAPDEIAREIRIRNSYGLVGGRA